MSETISRGRSRAAAHYPAQMRRGVYALQQAPSRRRRIRRLALEPAEHTHGLRDEPERHWAAVHAFPDPTSPTRS